MPDGYVVQCSDGPAAGWEYWTAIAPNERIIVQANPLSDSHNSKWMRMPDGTTEIPGSAMHYYKRGPLDTYTEKDPTGSVFIVYNVTEDGT